MYSLTNAPLTNVRHDAAFDHLHCILYGISYEFQDTNWVMGEDPIVKTVKTLRAHLEAKELSQPVRIEPTFLSF